MGMKMRKTSISESIPEVKRSKLQFLFPFMLNEQIIGGFTEKLLEEGFQFFTLRNTKQQNEYYGDDKVFHRKLEKYFLPNIEPLLFPKSYTAREGIRRFSLKLNLDCTLDSTKLNMPFVVESIDILVCPFRIGLMNLRISLPESIAYSDVIAFADLFRVLEPITEDEEEVVLGCRNHQYHAVKEFVFKELLRPMEDYVEDNPDTDPSYFGSLPFFMDERMYVLSYIHISEGSDLTQLNLFQLAELESCNQHEGDKHPNYIERYCKEHVYERWGDQTYIVMSDYQFSCITKETGDIEKQLASNFYGEFFYSVFLYYYYKIVLLMLSYNHSTIDIEKDKSKTELLIFMITQFSAKYYMPEVNSTTTGKEIFGRLQKIFRVETLYQEVKETLSFLYQSQDTLSGKSTNYLLQILTIYSTISGLFGMNLIIEDWRGKIPLDKMSHYSIFEWIAILVTTTGVSISLILGVVFIKNWLKERKSRKNKIL